MKRGIEKAAEHGPGVGESIGRLARVRPLLRFEVQKQHVIPSQWSHWRGNPFSWALRIATSPSAPRNDEKV